MKKSRRKGRRIALTLLEVLVATTLATVMVAILFRVLQRTIHAQRIDRDRLGIVSAFASDMMHRDLVNARGMRFDDRQWTLAGMFEPSHLPRTIRYEIRDADPVAMLVRIDGDETMRMMEGAVATNIVPLVTVVDEVATDDELDQTPPWTGGLPQAPDVFRWAVIGSNGRDLASGTVWSGNE